MSEEREHAEGSQAHSGGHGGGARGGGHGHGPGGGGGHEEAHEGAPEWLISFADNVALMMGFFVILLAMNMKEPTTGGIGGMENNGEPPTEKMLDAAIAIREAFNSPINLDSLDPRDAPLIKRVRSRLIQGDTVDPGPEGRNHDNQSVRPGDFTTVGGTIAFDDNSSELAPSAVTQVADLREHLAGHRWIIEVRGHVSAAESRRDEQKARRLSFERAWAVARVLAEQGIEWRQIRIVACGDSEPLRPRPHERGEHRSNQRAEVILTQTPLSEDPYSLDNTPRGQGTGDR